MKIRRPHVLLTLLALAACGDPSGPGDNVAEVRITPTTPSVAVGLTLQFSAEVLDATGQPVTGVTVSWVSSNTSVATIDDQGIAAGIGVGLASITATAGGATASQPLNVQANQCDTRIDVTLDPGQFQAYDGNQCLLLPAGQAGDRYRVAVFRPTQVADEDDVATVTLAIDPILTASQAAELAAAPPRPLVPTPGAMAAGMADGRPGIDGSRFVDEMRVRAATRTFHYELRERERLLDLRPETVLPDLRGLSPAKTSHPDPPPRRDMYLGLGCSASAATSPVLLIDFNDDIAIYQDSVSNAATAITTAATARMRSYYSLYVRDMLTDYWGPGPDTDGNERLIIVTTPNLPESAAAAVWSGDFLPNAPSGCESSNEGEVMYFDAEVITDMVDPDNPSYFALSVMAHEAKHVTSIYNGVQRGQFHDTWIEEGTAEISQTMSSRIAWAATGGPAVGEEITRTAILDAVNATSPAALTPEMWGVVGELADVIVNLSTQPNSLITNPTGASEFHTFYAQAWQLFRLVGDAWGDAATPFADAALFRALTAQAGPAGMPRVTAQTGRSFQELVDDVVVAISFHKTPYTPNRAFSTYDLFGATNIFNSPPEAAPPGDYPWPVTGSDVTPNAGFSSAVFSGPMGAAGIRFHDFLSNGVGQGAQILVTGAGSNGRIIVSRIDG